MQSTVISKLGERQPPPEGESADMSQRRLQAYRQLCHNWPMRPKACIDFLLPRDGSYARGAGSIQPRIEPLESRVAPAAAVLDLSALIGTNGFRIDGEATGDNAGVNVSDAGDFNGDGFTDLLIAAELADVNATDSGAVYLLFGTANGFPAQLPLSSLDGTNGFKITSSVIETKLGFEISTAGDFNNDGFDDIVLGTANSNFNGTNSGSAYLIFGGSRQFPNAIDVSTLNGATGFRIDGESGDELGLSVGAAGDFNGDGFADVVLSADGRSTNAPRAGSAYLLLGTNAAFPAIFPVTGLNGSNGFRIDGTTSQEAVGIDVKSPGDFNGDGLSDILLGTDEDNGSDAYVVFGQSSLSSNVFDLSTLDGSNGFRITPANADTRVALGTMRPEFDMNGDGLAEIVVGDSDQGYVIFGTTAPFNASFSLSAINGSNGLRLNPGNGEQLSGASNAGDLNRDGVDDLVVIIDGDRPGGPRGTLGYVVFGSIDLPPPIIHLDALERSSGFRIEGPAAQDFHDHQIESAGDLNGDGFDDLVVGALGFDVNGPDSGSAFVLFGFDTRIHVTGVQSAQFIEPDGDRVTVKVSKGMITPLDITLGPAGEFLMLDLSREGELLSGANVTIKAKRADGGDGFVDLGFLQAAGLDLGKVKVDGMLGRFVAGDGNSESRALKTLAVRTLGAVDDPGGTLVSEITGGVKAISIKGDVRHAAVDARGRLGKVNIGGDLIGNGPALLPAGLDAGGIIGQNGGGIPVGAFVATSIDEFTVNGSVTGGSVTTAEDLGILKIRGDLTKGAIIAEGSIRIIKIQGDVLGSDPNQPVIISALARPEPASPNQALGIKKVSIGGDFENALLLLGYNKVPEGRNPDAGIGKVVVKGDWRASSLVAGILDSTANGFGRDDTVIAEPITDALFARIGSVIIKGSASGSADAAAHFAITAQQIRQLMVNGVPIALDDTAPDDLLVDSVNGNFRVVEL